MRHLSRASRLVSAGAASSAICASAGIEALSGQGSLKVASALLVSAVVIAIVGYAYAENRRLGWGILAIIAATLPLFGALYAIGEVIMRHLGAAIAGGLLIALSVAVAVTAIVLAQSLRIPRAPPSRRRGSHRAIAHLD